MGNTKYQIGQRVYADLSGFGRVKASFGNVVKITPSGQTTVEFANGETLRFTRAGYIVGGGWSDFRKLIDKSAYDELCETIAKMKIRNNVIAARQTLNTIKIDADNKQALLAAVETLRQAIERL